MLGLATAERFRRSALVFVVLSFITLAARPAAACSDDLDCDDGDPCTIDTCVRDASADEERCGDSDLDGQLSITDAVVVLRFATGLINECSMRTCDIDGSGYVTAIDSLLVLTVAVGLGGELDCPSVLGSCMNDAQTAGGDVIDFEQLPAGKIVSTVFGASGSGPVGVRGRNDRFSSGTNAAVIFNSSCPGGCSGRDRDLGTPNAAFGGPGEGDGGRRSGSANSVAQRNILIVAENLDDGNNDGLVDDPDDEGYRSVELELDFSSVAPVTLERITLVDVDDNENPPTVRMFNSAGSQIASRTLPRTGNNGRIVASLGATGGVSRATVRLGLSGAIDDVAFTPSGCGGPPACPCEGTTIASVGWNVDHPATNCLSLEANKLQLFTPSGNELSVDVTPGDMECAVFNTDPIAGDRVARPLTSSAEVEACIDSLLRIAAARGLTCPPFP